VDGQFREINVKQRSISAVICFLVLSGCGSGSSDSRREGKGVYRAPLPARFSSECAEQAHTLRFRNVEVEPARPAGYSEWEAMVNATDQAGRDARLRCSYDGERVTIDRLER
jgi:hypothetical protein